MQLVAQSFLPVDQINMGPFRSYLSNEFLSLGSSNIKVPCCLTWAEANSLNFLVLDFFAYTAPKTCLLYCFLSICIREPIILLQTIW